MRYDAKNSVFKDKTTTYKRIRMTALCISVTERKNHVVLEIDDGTGHLTAIAWQDTIETIFIPFVCYELIGELVYYSEKQLNLTFAKSISLQEMLTTTCTIINKLK